MSPKYLLYSVMYTCVNSYASLTHISSSYYKNVFFNTAYCTMKYVLHVMNGNLKCLWGTERGSCYWLGWRLYRLYQSAYAPSVFPFSRIVLPSIGRFVKYGCLKTFTRLLDRHPFTSVIHYME